MSEPDPMEGAAEFPEGSEISSSEAPLSDRLKYGSPLHKELLGKLIRFRDKAEEPIKAMHESWNLVDEHMGLHVDLTRSSIKGDGSLNTREYEIPFEKALVVPVSFSVEKVIQAQLGSIFAGRDPQFQYGGNGPEDEGGAKLMEVAVAYDLRKGNFAQTSSQSIQNALRYGLAPVHSYWSEEWGYMQKPMVQGPMAAALGKILPDLVRPIRQWGKRCSHVQHDAIDPYKFRIDPRQSISTFQKGDIAGHEFCESLLFFKGRRLSSGEGPYFNCKQLEKSGWGRKNQGRSLGDEPGSKSSDDADIQTYFTEHLEIRIIPKDWNLSDNDRPEIWWFEWCGDDVIVRAHPSPYDHGLFNYGIGTSYPDANVVIPMGMGQMIDPFQRFMTWMASSRFENVRRFINNAALVMEDFIEVEDVMNPMPAGHIRLKQAAQDLIALGVVSDARVFFPQLQLSDVTRGHIDDIQLLFEWVGRMTGANDMSQGIHLPSKRTATEIDKLMGSASQRSQQMAEDLDSMLFGPLAEIHCMIRQQYSTDQQWFRIDGDIAKSLSEEYMMEGKIKQGAGGGIHAQIAPWDFYGQYDYIPYTGMDPNNPARSAENLIQLMQIGQGAGLNNPQQMMMMGEQDIMDLKEFVIRIGENLKVKDTARLFKPNPMIQVMQDQQLEAQRQAGNVVPAEQVMG